ncbi:MAG: DEAD/DEAH box helicase [Candidatus Altiarchaeota archaeon]
MTDFDKLNIRGDILQNIRFLGFNEMMPIQELAIPPTLSGKDLIGQAKTGTGKTLAFAIPIIEKIDVSNRSVQAIVLTPTRELALQVGLEFEKIAGSSITIALAYGGASINPQLELLRRGVHIVVGTPGRVIDLMKRRALKLENVKTFVLDEADRMLDMGFISDIEWIIKHTPKERQTLLFSATMPDEIRKLAEKYLNDPQIISANKDEDELTVGDVSQYYVKVNQKQKMDAFFQIIKEDNPKKALIFGKTKRWVEQLHQIIKKKGFSVDRIHGDMTQAAREKTINKLREGKVTFIVATDVAARGLDIDDITHVFNYDLPQEPLTYVHRIGRTARAGKEGVAITFITEAQLRDLWLIEHKARTKIQERKIKTN